MQACQDGADKYQLQFKDLKLNKWYNLLLSIVLVVILCNRNGSYLAYPKIMTESEETQKLLKQLIAKTDALDNKIIIWSDTLEQKINSLNKSIRTDINIIKRDLE